MGINCIFEGSRARGNDSGHYRDDFAYKVDLSVAFLSQRKRDLILSTELLGIIKQREKISIYRNCEDNQRMEKGWFL